MKKCVRFVTAWLLTIVMVAVTVFQWGGLAAGAGETVQAADLIDLHEAVFLDENGKDLYGRAYDFTGKPIKPEFTVCIEVNGKTQTVDPSNYTYEYLGDNVNATAYADESPQIKIYGIESKGYTGWAVNNYSINKSSIAKATVSFAGDAYFEDGELYVPYAKGGIYVPLIDSITYGDYVLSEYKDYILDDSMCSPDTAKDCYYSGGTLVLEGCSKTNFASTSREITWYIERANIADEDISLEYENCKYDGTAKKPKVTIKDSRSAIYHNTANELTEGTDFTVSYLNNTAAGQATVSIKGKGNYKGNTNRTFTISNEATLIDIGQATVNVANASYTGSAVKPKVTVTYNGITLTEGTDYNLSYSNNINIGTGKVTVNGIGKYSGSKNEDFSISKKNLNDATIQIAVGKAVYNYGHKVAFPNVTVTDTASGKALSEETDYTIQNEQYGSIVGDRYTFEIVAKDNSNYTGSRIGTYSIEPLDVSQTARVQLAQTEYEYTGAAFTPDVTSVTVNGNTLTKGQDYTVDYKNNTEVGDNAQAVVTFIGNYTGSATAYFKITSPLPNLKNAEISTIPDQTYTGSEIHPRVTVTLEKKVLAEGTDYTVSYENNKNVGTAVITITGNNKTCAGSRTVKFRIAQADITSCTITGVTSGQTYTYTGKDIRPSIRVTYNNYELTENTDYTVSYKSEAGNTINAGTVYVTVVGIGNYKNEKSIGYIIKADSLKNATIKLGEYNSIYDGTEKTPSVVSVTTESGKVLTDLSDFKITYSNAVNAGTATVAVAPKLANINYTDSVKTTFTIKKATLSNDTCTISTVSDQTFTENEIKPEPTLTIAGRTLVKGIDYTADYIDNINVGTATIRFTGTGNYTGNAVKTFNIVSKSIAGAKVTVPAQIYAGSAFAPSADRISVVLDGKTLDSKYYTVKYTNNKDAGTATATVTGKNGYSGSASGDFTIEKATIDSCTAEYSGKMMWNNGQAITPEITLKLGNYTLVKGTDYTVTYNNNQNETTKAEINVTGTGNFTGTKTYYFEITRNRTDINDSSIKVNASDLEYDGGKEVTPVITVTQNGKLLAEEESYDVAVINKTKGYEVGSVITVKLTGKDAFAGTREVTFEITAIDLTGAVAELEKDTFEYTGDAIIPVVKMITTKSGKKITDLSELKVQPSYNTNAGTATVTITGKTNNYTGSTIKTFEIQKKSIAAADIICEVKDAAYKGSQIQPKTSDEIKVTRNGKKLSLWTDYKIVSYGENINAGKDAGSIVIEGVNNYTGQKTVYFTINPQSIAGATVNVNRSYTYNGKAWEPQASDLTVSVNGRQLSSGDYTITRYDNNTNAGTATVTVAGVDNYTGTMTGKFTIAAKNLQDSSIDVRCASKVSYEDGKECKPPVRVYDGSKELTGNDYTVTYENNTAVTTEYSKAKAIIKGMGNYTGQFTKEFEISKDIINITGATVTVNKTFVYNGSVQTPEKTDITVKLADGTVLDNTSYTIVAVKDNIGAGTATITVEGCGDYSGTASGTYEITPKNITECQVHYSSGVDYTGMECRPGVTVMDGEAVELTKDKDYTVSYSNNTNPGTATITIKGQGNYTGIYTGSFTIVKKNDPTPEKINLSSAVITVADQTYTGQALIPSITVVLNGAVLPASAYTVAYSNNINVGTATVTVTGQGNYVGSASATFAIKAAAKPVTPTVTKPGKVKGISVKSVKTTSATLKWKKVSGASGYMIYRKNPSTGKSKLVKTVSSKTVSYKATKLKSATKYTYTIYAYKLSGKTKIKGSGTAYTFVTKPGAVKKTKAVSKKAKTCVVSWKKTKGADGYEVYMATSKKGKYKKIGQTKKLTLTKKKLKKGKTCYFKVRAYKTYKGKKTYGAYTKVIKAKIK